MADSIKKVPLSQVRLGMYIHDLNCDWMVHPFVRNQFLLKDEADLRKMHEIGLRDLYIDTSKGLGIQGDAPSASEVRAEIQAELVKVATTPSRILRVSVAEEMERARQIHEQAHRIVRSVMQDVRLGKAIEVADLEPLVEHITESVIRNSGALLSLMMLKNKDDYTFLHSVSVCTLMVTFARALGLPDEEVRLAGMGGLLHDTGKFKIPDEILNKPDKLTDEEWVVMRGHPEAGWHILRESANVGEIPLDITLHHHERMDGTGYPHRLPGDQISMYAQMAAVVDVYDAITSDRCYHKGMPATEALRKLFEWSKFHFNPTYVHAFVRTVGIYPTGTLVRLESGRLGVVVEQNEHQLLQPRVKVVFHTKSKAYLPPEIVDLAKPLGYGGGDKIVSDEDPHYWRIDVQRYLHGVRS